MKTLHIRMQAHQKNGLAVAKFLENNPRVEKVCHPGTASGENKRFPLGELGERFDNRSARVNRAKQPFFTRSFVLFPALKSHPQHEVAKRQMIGNSGMVTFYIKGGLEESRVFLKALKVKMEHSTRTSALQSTVNLQNVWYVRRKRRGSFLSVVHVGGESRRIRESRRTPVSS